MLDEEFVVICKYCVGTYIYMFHLDYGVWDVVTLTCSESLL